tara:strand:- start:1200 stop:1439 length:240 start_codon:yes stop_codon:yes gene_type:complete
MHKFYIAIYKGEIIVRVDNVDDLIKHTMNATSSIKHAPYPCMVSNDMEASMAYVHINYEEDETNNYKYGFDGIKNKYIS